MKNKNQPVGKRSRLMAICSVLAALGVVLLYVGSFIEVLDLSVALLASLAIVVLVIEQGGAYPWMTYAATAILSLLLLPNKVPAVVYTCFMGFYPIVKEKIEVLALRLVRLVLKLAAFNFSVVLMWFMTQAFIGEQTVTSYLVVTWGLLNGVFLFYDYALTVLITSYFRVWRRRLKIQRFFEK